MTDIVARLRSIPVVDQEYNGIKVPRPTTLTDAADEIERLRQRSATDQAVLDAADAECDAWTAHYADPANGQLYLNWLAARDRYRFTVRGRREQQ